MEEKRIKEILRKEGAKNIEISQNSGYERITKILISSNLLVCQFGEILKRLNIERKSCTIENKQITMYMQHES